MLNNNRLLKTGFVAPTLLFLIALNVFPLIYVLVLSFTNADLLSSEYQFNGGANYARVFRDATESQYAGALRTTGLFVFAAVTIELALGFMLALAIKRDFPLKTVVLALLLVPMMLSPAVMGLYWNLILNENYGALNQVFSMIGIAEPQWLSNPDLRFWTILMIDVWMWTPFMMLIALAGLNSIPEYIYEAAEIDRASTWTVFRRITLPMCAPLLFLAVLFRTTDALKQFDLVMAITGPTDASTQTLSALLYQIVFRSGKVGLGSAYAVVILVLVIALASMFLRYIDRIQQSQGRGT